MTKNLNFFLIIVFILIVGIVILKIKDFSSFGATSSNTWTPDTWYNTFGNASSTFYGFLTNQTNIPQGPYLLPDPGWTQPTQTNVSIVAASVTYANTLGIPSVTSNISNPIGFTWPGQGQTYTYSPTCISGIPNNYLYSTTANGITTITSTVTTQPLKLIPDTKTTITNGPWNTQGEYAAFNSYFQYDKYASLFMNNDSKFLPFTVNSSYTTTTVSLTPIVGVSYYSFFKSPFVESTFPTGTTTISYNQAIGIPADFAIAKTDTATNAAKKGTPGYGMNSITVTSVSQSQVIRLNIITGTLIAIHSLISQNIKQPSTAPAPLNGYTSNILLDLTKFYSPNAICSTTNLVGSSTPFYVSNNTSHAIYLTLMARDSWINNQLLNVNLL